jgi:hypothetical protein
VTQAHPANSLHGTGRAKNGKEIDMHDGKPCSAKRGKKKTAAKKKKSTTTRKKRY